MPRELRGVCRNPPSTSRAQTFTEEYLSTSRILRTFADNAPKVDVSRAVRFASPYFCPKSHLQSSPGQWDTEMLLAHGLIFEQVLPKMAYMFVSLIATYLRVFKWKFEELT